MILDFDKPSGAGHAPVEMADFAGAQDRDLLIGMGADSVERVDHRPFAAAYEAAGRHGLKRTMHAGEDGPSDNIAMAVREFGCDRVDHGFRLLDDPELTAEIVDRQIPLTVCPTSNVMIANVVPDVASHPYARQRELGVLATVNSDDPGMMRFDVADEYAAGRVRPRGDGGHQSRRHRLLGARRREGRTAEPLRGRVRLEEMEPSAHPAEPARPAASTDGVLSPLPATIGRLLGLGLIAVDRIAPPADHDLLWLPRERAGTVMTMAEAEMQRLFRPGDLERVARGGGSRRNPPRRG